MSAIHIVLHGLIALVPTADAGGMANHMTALLVDARQKPPGIQLECFAEHRPSLMVQAEGSECLDAGCTPSGADDCTCNLVRKEISLQPDVQPALMQLKKQPPSGLPFDQKGADDFSYIANLAQPPLNQKLDPKFLQPVPPLALVARMTFPFESLHTCSLGVRRDEGSSNVHPLGFRPLHRAEGPGEATQALGQQLAATYMTDASTVTVTLSDFGGGNRRQLPLKLVNGEYRIVLMNMRMHDGMPEDLPFDDPCDDGVGRDFAFFYELVQNPPPWEMRPIPHIKFTRWKSAKDLQNDACESGPTHGLQSRPICAMATFNP
jgi:hypothetical protein